MWIDLHWNQSSYHVIIITWIQVCLSWFKKIKLLFYHYSFYDAKAGSLLKTMPTNFGNIYDIKLVNQTKWYIYFSFVLMILKYHFFRLIKDKYLVVCGSMGTLSIFDLKKILNPSARDAIIASNLFNISSQDFWNDFTSVPRPSLQVVDEHQICVAIQFHTTSYSLFTFDFTGNRDFLKSRRNVLPYSSHPYVG